MLNRIPCIFVKEDPIDEEDSRISIEGGELEGVALVHFSPH